MRLLIPVIMILVGMYFGVILGVCEEDEDMNE